MPNVAKTKLGKEVKEDPLLANSNDFYIRVLEHRMHKEYSITLMWKMIIPCN